MTFAWELKEISWQILVGNISAEEGLRKILRLIEKEEDIHFGKSTYDLINRIECNLCIPS